MNYISPLKLSENWGISPRRIEILARDGRIPGAVKFGNRWMIPEDAVKPADKRKTKASGEIRHPVKKEESSSAESVFMQPALQPESAEDPVSADDFRFPLYLYYSETDLQNRKFLSFEEHELYEAQLLYACCSWEKAHQALLRITKTSRKEHILIGAFYYLCLTSMCLKKTADFRMYYSRLKQLVTARTNTVCGLRFILLDIQSITQGNTVFLDHFSLEAETGYPREMRPYLIAQSAYASMFLPLHENEVSLSVYELVCNHYRELHYDMTELSLHTYLAAIYMLSGNHSRMMAHLERAAEIAVSTKYYIPLFYILPYVKEQMKEVFLPFGRKVWNDICRLSEQFNDGFSYLVLNMKNTAFFDLFNQDEFRYVKYAVMDKTNKEIASLEKKSENTIVKRYAVLFEKLNVHSKKELRELYSRMVLKR